MSDYINALRDLIADRQDINSNEEALFSILQIANTITTHMAMDYISNDKDTESDLIIEVKHLLTKANKKSKLLPCNSTGGLSKAVADLLELGKGVLEDAIKYEETKATKGTSKTEDTTKTKEEKETTSS